MLNQLVTEIKICVRAKKGNDKAVLLLCGDRVSPAPWIIKGVAHYLMFLKLMEDKQIDVRNSAFSTNSCFISSQLLSFTTEVCPSQVIGSQIQPPKPSTLIFHQKKKKSHFFTAQLLFLRKLVVMNLKIMKQDRRKQTVALVSRKLNLIVEISKQSLLFSQSWKHW